MFPEAGAAASRGAPGQLSREQREVPPAQPPALDPDPRAAGRERLPSAPASGSSGLGGGK